MTEMTAVTMFDAFGWFSQGQVYAAIAGMVLAMVVVQSSDIPRWRWAVAFMLLLFVLAVSLSAQTPSAACMAWEPYSWEWWAMGCWYF